MIVRDISGGDRLDDRALTGEPFRHRLDRGLDLRLDRDADPASSSRPMRLPFRSPDRFIQSMSCTGRLMPSR